MKWIYPAYGSLFDSFSFTTVKLLSVLMILAGITTSTRAEGITRVQSIDLQPGWNAVHLEIDPLVSKPENLFADVPVDVVAAYIPAKSSAQFIKNPSANLLSVYGWAVWYAPGRSDDFLSSLFAIQGARSYLIHATTNTSLQIEGTIAPEEFRWIPNAYNYVGFSVRDPGGPTFQEFFSGSPAHNHNKIYRLVDGTWRQVLDPGSTAMRSGEAFWIYCDGHSDYTGPLEVSVPSVLGLVLSSKSGSEITMRNRMSHPLDVTVEHIVHETAPVPMALVMQGYDQDARGLRTLSMGLGSGAWTHSLPDFQPGKALRLPLEVILQEMTPGTRYSILKISTDLGTETYLSVTATRDDMP